MLKKIFTLFVITVGLVVFSKSTYASLTDDEMRRILNCEIDPNIKKELTGTNGSQKWNEYQTELQRLYPDYKRTITKSAFKNPIPVNKQTVLDRCLIVYGTPESLLYDPEYKDKQRYSTLLKEWRYIGYNDKGEPFPSRVYYDRKGDKNYVLNTKFIPYPWNHAGILKQSRERQLLKPINQQKQMYDQRRLAALRTTVDDFYWQDVRVIPNGAQLSMNFLKWNAPTNERFIHSISPGTKLTGANTPLTKYAVVSALPTNFSAGIANLYMYSNESKSYWYSNYLLPPLACVLVCSTELLPQTYNLTLQDSVTFNPVPPKVGGIVLNSITVKVKNTGKAAIKAPIDIKYHWVGESTFYCHTENKSLAVGQEITVVITKGKPNCAGTAIPLKVPISAEASKTHQLEVHVNHLKKNPPSETIWSDNKRRFPYTATSFQNAKVVLNKSRLVAGSGTPINLSFRVTNESKKTIDANCKISSSTSLICGSTINKATVTIKNKSASSGFSPIVVPYTYSIAAGKTKDMLVKEKLPPGEYDVTVQIPQYAGETNPPKWTDNKDSLSLTVKPIPPSNTTCKFIKPQRAKYVGTKGVAKMCIGSYPNFPSTQTEGGQGSYYYVLYRFMPMPIPDYDVTDANNYGIPGVEQKLTLSENNSSVGATDTFLNYPTSESNPRKLKGPYTLGPHSDYHYKYRGRLFATSVDFTYQVRGPRGDTLSIGEIKYDIPNNCFDSDILDYRQGIIGSGITAADFSHCRELIFYLPNNENELSKMYEAPSEDKRLQFKNPGIHTFQFDALEHQEYRYQVDDGYEMQGKKGVMMIAENGKKVEGPIVVKKFTNKDGSYNIRDDIKNHCYTEQDAFADKAFDGEVCFHDHSKDFHYWKYIYSKPKWYGMDFK